MTTQTLETLLRAGIAALRESSDSAQLDTQILLCHAAAVTKVDLIRDPQRPVPERVVRSFDALVARRHAGEPVAYIIGTREFWSLTLRVTPATLVPRPETETLVELALSHIPRDETTAVADLGTGSGAIALAIAAERPRARVLATDISSEALAVAQHNAKTLGLANVSFIQGEWLAPLGDEKFAVIVSNPPYVAEGDPHLSRGDLRYEPPLALACGADGLTALRHIAHDARQHLLPDGWLLMEHGYDQASTLIEILQSLGYRDVADHADLAGIPRVITGRWV